MKKLNVGIIGFGFMGKTHTYAYRAMPFYYDGLPFEINLAAVCSGRLPAAEAARERYGFGYASDDMLKVAEDKNIDIVNICTPNNLHAEAAIAALKAGKHVYCDKPLAVSAAQADEIARVYKFSAGLAQMTMQYRFYPATLRAKKIIDEGRLGRILSFRACYLHSGAVDPDRPVSWRHNASCGGGVFFDMGVHILDLMYHLMGEYKGGFWKPQTIYSKRPAKDGSMVDIEVDDASYMVLEMMNGAVGTVEVSKVSTGTNDDLRFEIHGDKGALRFSLIEPDYLYFYDGTAPNVPLGGTGGFTAIECVQRYSESSFPGPKYAIGWIRGHIHCLYNFLSCIAGGKQPSPSFEEAAYIMHIMEKLTMSNEKFTCF